MESAYWEEEKESGISARKAFGKLLPLLKEHKRRLSRNLLLLIVATASSLVGPIIIRLVVDDHIVPGRDYGGLLEKAALFLASMTLFLVASYYQRVHLEIVGQDIITKLKQRCFDHVTSLSVRFFDNNPVGRLMSRIESDGESLRQLFASIVVMMIGDLMLLAGMLSIMFYINWQLSLWALSVVPPVLLLLVWFVRFTTPRFLAARKRSADISATITEYLQGMSVIQVFNRQETVRDRVNDVNRSKFMVESRAEWGVVGFFNTIFFMETVAVVMVLYFGAKYVMTETVSEGTLVMFVFYIRRFFEPIHRFSEEVHVIQKAIAGARRIFALLSNDEIIADPSQPRSWRHFEDAIRFEDVWFSYAGDDNYATRDVSFEVKKGEKVALVGVTGGGKSTIVNLLLRFYDCSKGRITVDGLDIRELAKDDLRAKFGLVLQDIFLFPGDVKENITLGEESISDETLRRVTQMVSADRFINRLPKGLQTEIAERGSNISRGERQLLSFARAMLYNPEILLLDEATSSVDPDTEKRIQTALKRLLKGRTSIIIAHRLSTILDADKILVLRDGEIIERGSHEELLDHKGYYEKLFRLQFQRDDEVKVT